MKGMETTPKGKRGREKEREAAVGIARLTVREKEREREREGERTVIRRVDSPWDSDADGTAGATVERESE